MDVINRVNGGEVVSYYSDPGEDDYKTLESEDKVYRNAPISIIGNKTKNTAHQIPNAKSCRCYYGPIAECAAGLQPIPEGTRKDGWNVLLNGLDGEITDSEGNEIKMSEKGLEKLAESLLILMKRHDGVYDTYVDGILLTLPITTLDDAVNWQQGEPVD